MSAAQNRSRPNRIVTNVPLELVEEIEKEAKEAGVPRATVVRDYFLFGWHLTHPVPSPQESEVGND